MASLARPFLTTGAALVLWLAYCLSGVASRLLRIMWHRPETVADAVRFGLLGAAKVAPHGLLYPAAMIESATVVAVGARDPSRAHRMASKWGIPRSGDYASVLADPSVEAVYIPLLNGLHYEWAAAALRAGKHVLCEKPLTSNTAEARALSQLAKAHGLVLFEAFHYRYHPLAARVRSLVGGGSELGEVLEIEVSAGLPSPDSLKAWLGLGAGGAAPPKMDVALGGGNFMGQGCYAVSMARLLLGDPERVLNATMAEAPPGSRADVSTAATLAFAGGAIARLTSSALAVGFDLRVRCERGSLTVRNYLFPFVYHSLQVAPAHGAARTEQHYGGGETTFELQLRAFVAAVRHGAPFATTADDAVANMQVIDAIYDAAGLGARGSRIAACTSS